GPPAAPEPASRAQPDAGSGERPAAETGTQVEPVAVAAKPDNIAQASIDREPAGSAGGATPAAPPRVLDADAVLPDKVPYASPAVRVFARELGVDLLQVTGSARGGRISREDVQQFVKSALAGGVPAAGGAVAAGGGGLNLLPWPKVDFSKFGEVEEQPLTRI